MGAANNNIVGAKEPKTEGTSPKQEITDVYIGVFFDGTNNNMLWTAMDKVKKYRDKLKKKYDIENGYEQFGQKASNIIKIQDGLLKVENNNFNLVKIDIHDLEDIDNLTDNKIDKIIKSHNEEYDKYLADMKKSDSNKTRKEFIEEKIKKIDEETKKAGEIIKDHSSLDDNEWDGFVKIGLTEEQKCNALKNRRIC